MNIKIEPQISLDAIDNCAQLVHSGWIYIEKFLCEVVQNSMLWFFLLLALATWATRHMNYISAPPPKVFKGSRGIESQHRIAFNFTKNITNVDQP